jgi:exopolysaccharide biosynthesis polyprenyl glycosylphosphotransferase
MDAVPAGPGRTAPTTPDFLPPILLFGDITAVLAAVAGAVLAFPDGHLRGSGPAVAAGVTVMLGFIVVGGATRLWSPRRLPSPVAGSGLALSCWLAAAALMVVIALMWDGEVLLGRTWLLGLVLLGTLSLLGWRFVLMSVTWSLAQSGRYARRVVLVGEPDRTALLRDSLTRPEERAAWALLDEIALGADATDVDIASVTGRLGGLLRTGRPPEIVMVALPEDDAMRIWRVCRALRDLPLDVCLAPSPAALWLPHSGTRRVGGHTALEVWPRPLGGVRGAVKRMEDVVLGTGLLLLFAPIMLLSALAISLTTPGPALLRQARYGLGNRVIHVWKFRTMYHDLRDVAGARATTRGDPRVTPVGRLLRKTSLDELPQLFNVLRGDMSLVGPRAHPVEMRVGDRYYEEVVQSYSARHRMKPGITGLAQISGHRGLVDTQEKAEARLRHDLAYVERWSLLLDLRILWRTIFKGFWSEGAY